MTDIPQRIIMTVVFSAYIADLLWLNIAAAEGKDTQTGIAVWIFFTMSITLLVVWAIWKAVQ